MTRYPLTTAVLTLCVCVAAPSNASAIVFGQVDDFQDAWNSTQGWYGSVPTTVVEGGPAGAGDKHLKVQSTGAAGPEGTLCAINRNYWNWQGDYLSAGVTAVGMDLCNQGVTTLQMRVFVYSQVGGAFASSVPYLLPADGQWHHATFRLTASDMTLLRYTSGSTSLEATLRGNDCLKIYHQTEPLGNGLGTPIATQLGIDNIRAIPEPEALALLAVALCIYLTRRTLF